MSSLFLDMTYKQKDKAKKKDHKASRYLDRELRARRGTSREAMRGSGLSRPSRTVGKKEGNEKPCAM